MFRRAAEFKMPAVAMTDHGNMFGAVEFYNGAKKHGLKPIVGCEVYVAPESRHDKKEKYWIPVFIDFNIINRGSSGIVRTKYPHTQFQSGSWTIR